MESQWSYNLFGIECGDGWKSLYQPIIDYIQEYNRVHEGTDSFIEIHQIKEKFGGLRFYWGGENVPEDVCDVLREMIRDAEAESFCVCEICGSRDNVGITVDNWYTTICEDCLKKTVKNTDFSWRQSRKWRHGDNVYIINKESNYEQDN